MVETAIIMVAAEQHATPVALGLDPTGWVALSMIAVFALMIWKKVPAIIGAALDKQIAGIKSQLDTAATLRAEAEALKVEYQTKLAALDGETAAMRARAEAEATALVAKAKNDVKTLIARRQKTAEERIAAAERTAIADVRDSVVRAAADAARNLIAEQHTATADAVLVERALADIAKL
ncbi:MAG: F0F1 ATP synthase subunit B [Pseudomonadota bacterium]